MGDLALDDFDCGDYFGVRATHGEQGSRPVARDQCKPHCEHQLLAARNRDCGLTCHGLAIDCPCAAPPPPPAPPPACEEPGVCAPTCEPVPYPCCDATLDALAKFCHSFEPPVGGWPPACKSADKSHWAGGAYVPSWHFEPLFERYAPAQCQHDGHAMKRVIQR